MKADKIIGAVQGVTKKWAKQRKAEERHAAAVANQRDAMMRHPLTTIRDAAFAVMEQAYLKATLGDAAVLAGFAGLVALRCQPQIGAGGGGPGKS